MSSIPDDDGRIALYGGLALGIATLLAMLVANSPLGPYYHALLETMGEVRIGPHSLSQTLEHWINDGLMAIFFLLVGLEIKREFVEGALATARSAALPIIAAAGGFVFPAVLYAAFNWNNPQTLPGWAIPSCTDIAFVLGICAVLGRLVPVSLRMFLLALAIIDDLMAIIVIAIFYTDNLSTASLVLAAVGIAGLFVLNRLDARAPALYVVVGIFTWVSVLQSGVHATLAGVAVGLAIPMTRHDGESLLDHAEHALKPWVSYAIVPMFAFANAGVSFSAVSLSTLTAAVPLGIVAGLFVGKQVGVFVVSFLAIRPGLVDRPSGATLGQLYGVAVLCGVGFTMSLFVGTLAFDDEATMAQVRLGVMIASILSAVVAAAILRLADRSTTNVSA